MKSQILQEAFSYAILRGLLFDHLFQQPPYLEALDAGLCWPLGRGTFEYFLNVNHVCKSIDWMVEVLMFARLVRYFGM